MLQWKTGIILAMAFMASSVAEEEGKRLDVVVYSATPCGIASSITAAREGANVVLVEPTRHVGGLSTSGLNTAEIEHMLQWTVGGFADEFYRRLGEQYGRDKPAYGFGSGVAEEVYLKMLDEAGVDVHYGASIEVVRMSGQVIQSIRLTDGSDFSAKVFVDASYEGDLMARAGVAYAVGRESKDEFDEEAAGVRFDKVSQNVRTVDGEGELLQGISAWAKDLEEGTAHPEPMNYNFRLTVTRDPQARVPIPKPKHYDASRFALIAGWLREQSANDKPLKLNSFIDFYGRRNGRFEMNNKQSAIFSLGHFGGQFGWPDASYEERQRIYDDHLDYTLGLLHFLATDAAVPENVQEEMMAWGLHRDEFVDNGHLPYQLYVREGRRMRGSYVVKQQDVQTDRRKADSIGVGSHFMDCHHVQRVALNENEFVNEGRIWRMGYAYQIPYRAIIPKAVECTNLLVPCAASFTHVAYCTLRVEATWMVTGHAAGVAAAMAAADGRDVQRVDVAALQDKLRQDGQVVDFLPGMPEKCTHLNGPPEF